MAEPHTDREPSPAGNSPGGSDEPLNPSPRTWHILLFVLAATFIAYARTLSFGFVHDDFVFLVNNPAIHSWQYLSQYFTASVWEGVYPGIPGNYYRPVFLIWVRLHDALFGDQAGLWHLTTVATHLATTALVYYLALRLLKDRFAAGVAALVFGLHPVHIEAVAWISGVTEPLLGVFFIGAFLCHLRMRDEGEKARIWFAAALFLYVVGLLEKETEILLPAVIFAYEWVYAEIPGRGNIWNQWRARSWRAIRAAGPFLLVTIPYLTARIIFLKGFSHPATRLSLSKIVFTWPALIWFWIRHLLVPMGLGTFYDLRIVEHPGLGNFILPLVGSGVVAGLLVWGALRSRTVAFAGALLIFPLLPFLDLRMFQHNNFAQDRYLYLPSVALALLVGLAVRRFATGQGKFLRQGAAPVLSMMALALPLGFATWQECFYFRNNWIFYRYNYLLSPHNAHAANDYAVVLELLGMKGEAGKVLEQAVMDDPDYGSATYNLGRFYYETGRLGLARKFLTKALQIDPAKADAYFCLGLTELQAGHPKQAEREFRAALQVNPKGKEFHYELGLALKALGEPQAALAEFEAELAVNPRHPGARRLAREMQAPREPPAAPGKGVVENSPTPR